MTAPGSHLATRDVWGRFDTLSRAMKPETLVLLDRSVARLHPGVARALERARPRAVLTIAGGERAKSFEMLDQVLRAGVHLPRSGTLLAIGGGSVGDLGTTAAHLLKRGVRLVLVPTTLLAAVDSSVGGKGAVHLEAAGRVIKNGVGVFHYPEEAWLCPELFASLDAIRLREGAIEAVKMAVCLDAALWRSYRRRAPALRTLVTDARRLKAEVCARDPYERSGERFVLNFGHTLGHVLESVTRFALSHGEAVGLGMLCACDIGRALGDTSEPVADELEQALQRWPGTEGRAGLAAALRGISTRTIGTLLAADKKVGPAGEVRMVLLRRPGETVVRTVPREVWSAPLAAWRRGARP